MSSTTGYSITGYGSMVADQGRTRPYVEALRRVVQPGSVVLDIGAGTGIFACLACRFGARQVYAIEPDNAIQVARDIAHLNGYADRIEFIQDLSTHITLPEPVHLIVSDLRGVLPLYQHHIPAIVDARQRHLAAGGTLIPARDTLWVAAVEAPELWRQHVGPTTADAFGIDMQPAITTAANTWRRAHFAPGHSLTGPMCWATLDYSTVVSPDVEGEVELEAHRPGMVHGLTVWFDTALAAGIGFSNAPGEPELIYGQAFFPLLEPVALAEADRLVISLAANLVGADYLWRWDTTIIRAGRVHARFRQSTFFGAPLSRAQLHKRGARYVPSLNEDGQIRQFVLNHVDGHRSLDDIACALADNFPRRFASWRDALTMVADLAQKYSQ